MQTRRQSRDMSSSLGRTISLRNRMVDQSQFGVVRSYSTHQKEVVKVSKYTLKCRVLPETIELTPPSKSGSSKYSTVSNISKRKIRKESTPSKTAGTSETRSRKTVRINSQNQPTKEKQSTPLRYLTRSASRVTPAMSTSVPSSNKADLKKRISDRVNVQTHRAVTRSMADHSLERPIKVAKKRKVDEDKETSMENDLNATRESGSLSEFANNFEKSHKTTSILQNHRKSLRKRKIPVNFPLLSHKLRQIRRSRCFGKTSISSRGKISSSMPTSLSSQTYKRLRNRPIISHKRHPTARSGNSNNVENSDASTSCLEPDSSASSKRLRRLSHVSSVSGRSIDNSSVASSKSTVACVQNRPSLLGLSCRLRSRRRVVPFLHRLGLHSSPFKSISLKPAPPVIVEDNKENRNQSTHQFSNQSSPLTSVFKTPSMITRHASHLSKAIIHAPAIPQTPTMNARTISSTIKSLSPTRAVLTPSQLSVAESVGGESVSSSMRSLFNSIKSPEKLQGERLKKLKSRWIEHDTDAATETGSQLSALSPSIASVLNGTEQDSKERLMELLEQHSVKSWSDVFDSHEELTKIGEGVYGEVFQINGCTGDVIKIFPIEGDMSIMDGSRAQMTFHTVYPEVYVSKRLTELAKKARENRTVCFSQLKRATLVKGKLPESFVIQWKVYDALYSSENICLNHLPESQLWIILEYEYAGVTLDKYKFTSYLEARSVFEQLSLSLAAGEAELQFEHRDLHCGNVLVRPTRLDKLRFRVNGVNYSVWTYGVRATIIDFTVSRMCYRGNTVYVDMSENPEIFNVYDGEYQNEIYRMMRLLNGNDWRSFKPKTNLMWLHYLCDKLLHEVKICARGDTHFEAIYSELVALEEELRQVVQPPLNVLRSVPNSYSNSVSHHHNNGSSATHSKGGSTHHPTFSVGKGNSKQTSVHNLQVPQYAGAADFVTRNFYFDSCRIGSCTGL